MEQGVHKLFPDVFARFVEIRRKGRKERNPLMHTEGKGLRREKSGPFQEKYFVLNL